MVKLGSINAGTREAPHRVPILWSESDAAVYVGEHRQPEAARTMEDAIRIRETWSDRVWDLDREEVA